MGDGYSELCTEAWNIADRMLEADRLSSDKKRGDSESGELTHVALNRLKTHSGSRMLGSH